MSYPIYRRNGNTFYKVVDESTVTKIEPDENVEYYQYCGLTLEDAATVESYSVSPVDDWMAICNDMKETARVGSRPNIPPPPHEE